MLFDTVRVPYALLLKDRQLLIRPILVRGQYIDHWDRPLSDSYT